MSLRITEEMIARQPAEAQAIIRLLLAHIAQQDRRIAVLEAELATWRKTPRNSSLPPSSEHPHAKPNPPQKRSRKKQGGQPGPVKHERPLIPVEDCAAVLRRKPSERRRCGAKLRGDDPEPLRQARAGRRPIREDEGPACGSQIRSCRRSNRWSLSISGIAWSVPVVANGPAPNCRSAFPRDKRGRDWWPSPRC